MMADNQVDPGRYSEMQPHAGVGPSVKDSGSGPELPLFELDPAKPGIGNARPIVVHALGDRLVEILPKFGSWVPNRPPEEVLVAVRAALSRLVLVLTLPDWFDVGAANGFGNQLRLFGLTLSFPETWPAPVQCPFEVAALRFEPGRLPRVALRLVTPKPPRPRWRPASTRRRGRPAVAIDLFRARVLEMARQRSWSPEVADLFRRAGAAKSGGELDRWPMELSAMLAGLIVEDIWAGRTTTPTAVRFARVLLVAEQYYRRFRKLVDSRVRSPRALLGRLTAMRLFSPREQVRKEFDALFAELRDQAGFDMSQESHVRELRALLKHAATAGATTRRALTRVRTQWMPVPAGFVADQFRVARLDPRQWNFLFDQESFAKALEKSAAQSRETGSPDPASGFRMVDNSFRLYIPVLGAPGNLRLANPGFSMDDVSWMMPATMHIWGWTQDQPPPAELSVRDSP